MHGEDAGPVGHPGDRHEVAQHVVRKLAIEALVDAVSPGAPHDERVAVRHRTCGKLGADDPARSAAVVDDDLLAKRGAQRPGKDARPEIDEAAGRERNDEAHGPRGPGIRGEYIGGDGKDDRRWKLVEY